MTEFGKLLEAHALRYSAMQPQDAVKLAYQSEFGGGHMIGDVEACKAYLAEEYAATVQDADTPLIEDIGGGMIRLQLAALDAEGITPAQAARLFIASANQPRGTKEGLLAKLECIREQAEAGVFGFDAAELAAYLQEYAAAGYPAVRHSEQYRAAYQPAYRVIDRRWMRMLPLMKKIDALQIQQERVCLAIEGRAASGKTTLASRLAALYGADCCVIHMDDFFLPMELRTEARYAQAGGNIHYERFMEQVASHLQEDSITYAPFDCSVGDYGAKVTQKLCPLTVIEGSYSMHPYFRDPYDLHVFLELAPAEQKQRILQRNGPEWYVDFEEKWIPMEEAYFAACKVSQRCDLILRV